MIPKIDKLAAGGLVSQNTPLIGEAGCTYVIPCGSQIIGIGITTTPERNLVDVSRWRKFMPPNARLTICCDTDLEGVAVNKNGLLAELEDCDHIFLFDDDTYPIHPDWWKPYVEHPEPHLMYQFKLPGKPATDMRELYRDDITVAYSHTRGAMIYIERRVLDIVGGMDTRYVNGFEHPDWTTRIHNAGLTTYRAMDVPNSHELLYCLDQDGKVQSSITSFPKRENYRLYDRQRQSKEYMEFRS